MGTIRNTWNLRRVESATRKFRQLRRSFRSKALSIKTWRSLFVSLICPIYEYGIHLIDMDIELELAIEKLNSTSVKWCVRTASKKLEKWARAALDIEDGKVRRQRLGKNLQERLTEAATSCTGTGEDTWWECELLRIYLERMGESKWQSSTVEVGSPVHK